MNLSVPLLRGNWVDLILVIIFLIYLWGGVRRGFFLELIELFGFTVSFFVALRFYSVAGYLLVGNFSLPRGIANALGFLLIGFLGESLFSLLGHLIFRRISKSFIINSFWEKILGILPAFFNAFVLSAFLLTLFVALPVKGAVKADILASKIGGPIVAKTAGIENQLNVLFEGAIRETLTFLTVRPMGEERIDLQFKMEKKELTVDTSSEEKMFSLINQERKKEGMPELTLDLAIREVARKHSFDMWRRGYFSHYTPEGVSPFERLREGGVSFLAAGENLALAPNVDLAHMGLMNSPRHRANILSPEFKRVGIGAVDGGVYGKMFVQNFTD